MRGKPAIIVICFEEGGEYWWRCPNCESLNINDSGARGGDAVTCPDCGQRITYPTVQICPCKGSMKE